MKKYTLENSELRVEIIDYGARIMSIYYKSAGVHCLAGCDSPEDYLLDEGAYFGAAVGRYANRICRGRFSLGGKEYQLPINNGVNSLHGGHGFSMRYFECEQVSGEKLVCSYNAAHMEEGYPGNFALTVEYTLQGSALSIRYTAKSDGDTVCNLTNHAYFNLNGGGSAMDHVLCLHADEYLPIDETSIPLGEAQSVAGTPFDFREATPIGARINDSHPQLAAGQGYDHNFILRREGMREIGYLYSAQSGVRMDVLTDQPGVQFYSGNFMDSAAPLMRGGVPQRKRDAVCLETQHYPDSPNHPDYPDTTLRAGEVFKSETVYRFSKC